MSEKNEYTPDTVVKLLRDARIAMVTSIGPDSSLLARPMAMQEVLDDGDMWFFVRRSSDQAKAVEADPRVNVSISERGTWISVAGTATVTRDQDLIEKLWDSSVEAWFPDGKTDPDIGLMHVNAESAEYWDSPGGQVASLISFVKSKATGQPMDGDNETTRMPQ